MPNHVTTVLSIEDNAGVPLADIRKVFINDKGKVDLNVVKPMPECLRGFEPHSGIVTRVGLALGLLPDPNSIKGNDLNSIIKRLDLNNALREATTQAKPEDISEIIRAIQNYAECGYAYWSDWCNDNWGTKWNCYGQPEDGHPDEARSFEFETAWSHPAEMICEISKRLPGVAFLVRFADEDLGSNCGQYSIKNGDTYDAEISPRYDKQSDDEKRRFTEMAFRLRHGDDADPAAYGYGPDWVYSDEIYEAANY